MLLRVKIQKVLSFGSGALDLRRRRSGFTLIEFIIYFLLLGVVITAIVGFMLDALETRTRVVVAVEVEQNLRHGISRVLRATRQAESLDIGGSAFDSNNGVLSLNMADALTDPTVFDLSDGALRIQEGSASSTPLTSAQVNITKLYFTRDTLLGGTKSITVQITAEYAGGGDLRFEYVNSTSGTSVIRRQR